MRRALLVLAVVTTLVIGSAPTGSASAKGGWALASFDELPTLVAGDDVDVTFRILQHGVHPVEPASWLGMDVHLDVRGPDGTTSVPALPTGSGGRFLARVHVPAGEVVGLTVVWPGGLLLESAAVDVPVAPPPGSSTGPDWWTIGLGAVALAALAMVVVDVVRARAARHDELPADAAPAAT